MKNFLIVLLVIILLGSLGYYSFNRYKNKVNTNSTPSSSITSSIVPTQVNSLSLSEANNQFAFKLYAQLNNNSQNVFFSPYSMIDAFGMVDEGAKDGTAQEIINLFQFTANDGQRRNEFLTLQNKLNQIDTSYQLKNANALWVEQTFSILDNYKNIIKQYYQGTVSNVDFKTNPEGSRQTINNWIASQTNNKIKNLFGQNTISENNRLVLTNAIYFKGDWVNKFSASKTKDDNFTTSAGQTIKTSMMMQRGNKFNYYEDNVLQILQMPYIGDALSMVVLLPKNNEITTLEKSLNTSNLVQWCSKLTNQEIDVYLPKFTFDTKYDTMKDTLRNMGLILPFTVDANFSGIDGKQDLYINQVIHQAYVGVDEEGTEAAAATGVGMEASSAIEYNKVPVFRADHPFIFFIQDNATGTILFMGKLNNPVQ